MIVRGKAFGTDFLGIFLANVEGKLIFHSTFPKRDFLERGAEALNLKLWEVGGETSLLGIFVSGNSKGGVSGIEIPGLRFLGTRYTALGNLIVANDKGALIAPCLESVKREIEKALGVKARTGTVGGMEVVGSLVLANNKGALVSPEASEEEIELIEKALKVDADYGTVAKSGFLGSMAVVSDEGALIPESALAPEIAQLQEVLEIE